MMETFKGADVAPIDEMLERTHFVRALLAQLAETQRLLDAANAELHDLRIRAGLGEIGPDWAQAPEWANYWAMDADGWSYWYSCEPETQGGIGGYWANNDDGADSTRDRHVIYWRTSLHQRPGQPATEKESS